MTALASFIGGVSKKDSLLSFEKVEKQTIHKKTEPFSNFDLFIDLSSYQYFLRGKPSRCYKFNRLRDGYGSEKCLEIFAFAW